MTIIEIMKVGEKMAVSVKYGPFKSYNSGWDSSWSSKWNTGAQTSTAPSNYFYVGSTSSANYGNRVQITISGLTSGKQITKLTFKLCACFAAQQHANSNFKLIGYLYDYDNTTVGSIRSDYLGSSSYSSGVTLKISGTMVTVNITGLEIRDNGTYYLRLYSNDSYLQQIWAGSTSNSVTFTTGTYDTGGGGGSTIVAPTIKYDCYDDTNNSWINSSLYEIAVTDYSFTAPEIDGYIYTGYSIKSCSNWDSWDTGGPDYNSRICSGYETGNTVTCYYEEGEGQYEYDCYDMTSGDWIDSNTYETKTNEDRIYAPDIPGYSYLGYNYGDSWRISDEGYTYTTSYCSRHSSSNPIVVFFYEEETSGYYHGTYHGIYEDPSDAFDRTYLEAYAIDRVKIEAPEDGFVEFIVNGDMDMVAWSNPTKPSIERPSATRGNNILDAEYQIDEDKDENGEANDYAEYIPLMKIAAGDTRYFGWYAYKGEAGSVSWEVIYSPMKWYIGTQRKDTDQTIDQIRFSPSMGSDGQEIEYALITPTENGTLSITIDPSEFLVSRMMVWVAPYNGGHVVTAAAPGEVSGRYALEGDYIVKKTADNRTTFTVDLIKDQQYAIYVNSGFQEEDPDMSYLYFSWNPAAKVWQTPSNLLTITGSAAPSSGTLTLPGDRAGYITYQTPNYKGKLICETRGQNSSGPDFYSHLSTSTLSANSGNLRESAVNSSVTGYITANDNGGGNLDTKIIVENCSASTKYYWYTNAAFSDSATYSMPYYIAYWRQRTLSYDANGGTGAPTAQTFYDDNFSVQISTTVPTRSNYQFMGWSKNSDASIVHFNAGDAALLSNSDHKLYAVWQPIATNVTITYNINGGSSGAPGAQSVEKGSKAPINTSTIPIRANYVFKGWHTESNAKKPLYKKEQSYTITVDNNITLYAIWWPDFNWNLRNAEEADLFASYINTYITTINNIDVERGDPYDSLWFNSIAAYIRATPVETTELITNTQLNELVEKYRNY